MKAWGSWEACNPLGKQEKPLICPGGGKRHEGGVPGTGLIRVMTVYRCIPPQLKELHEWTLGQKAPSARQCRKRKKIEMVVKDP